MRIRNYIMLGKYPGSIAVVVTFALFAVIVVFSIATFVTVRKRMLDSEYQHNRSIMYQVKYNLDYMDEMVRTLCLSMYTDNSTVSLMYNGNTEFSDTYGKLLKLQQLVNTIPFLHSIYVYNGVGKYYYSTRSAIVRSDVFTDDIAALGRSIPLLKPVLMRVKGGGLEAERVFSYFMYESPGDGKMMNGALILNVKSEWLLHNIQLVNSFAAKKHDKLFLLDDGSRFIDGDGTESRFTSSVTEALSRVRNGAVGDGSDVHFFEVRVGRERYLMTSLRLGSTGLSLLKAQLRSEVYQDVNRLTTSTILITLMMMIVAALVARYISKRIARPVERLVKQVQNSDWPKEYGVDSPPVDEIDFLSKLFLKANEQLARYEQEKSSEKHILKKYLLRSLLLESSSMEESSILMLESSELDISLKDDLLLCVLKIDGYAKFEQELSQNDLEFFKFSIIQILKESVSRDFAHEALDMGGDRIAIIMNPRGKEEAREKATRSLHGAQSQVKRRYTNSLTVSVSDSTTDYRNLARLYDECCNTLAYRFLFGYGSVLHPEMVRENAANRELRYPSALEGKVVTALRNRDSESFDRALREMEDEIRTQSYTNAMVSVIFLVSSIQNQVRELNASRPQTIDAHLLSGSLFELGTLDRLHSEMVQAVGASGVFLKDSISQKHAILVENVKDFIRARYADSSLCLSQVAAKYRLSESHLGKVFRQVALMSVSEYINEVRLEKAIEWMEGKRASIAETSARVGIENETYFYRMFKKRYGMTPKQYVLNRIVQDRIAQQTE